MQQFYRFASKALQTLGCKARQKARGKNPHNLSRSKISRSIEAASAVGNTYPYFYRIVVPYPHPLSSLALFCATRGAFVWENSPLLPWVRDPSYAVQAHQRLLSCRGRAARNDDIAAGNYSLEISEEERIPTPAFAAGRIVRRGCLAR